MDFKFKNSNKSHRHCFASARKSKLDCIKKLPLKCIVLEFPLWYTRINSVFAVLGRRLDPGLAQWVKRIQHCGVGHNRSLDLIHGPGTPYVTGQPKRKKKVLFFCLPSAVISLSKFFHTCVFLIITFKTI